MADRIAKLYMVTGENNNKYYFMTENNGTIDIEYGRVDVTKIKLSKPSREWEKIYNSKVKKGYVDQAELFVEKKDIIVVDDTTTTKKKKTFTDFLASRKSNVVNIVKQLQAWATGSIKENYSVESKEVTQKQIDTAQGLIDQLAKYVFSSIDVTEFNKILLSYYMTVPRRMKRVKEHLLSGDNISELETNRNVLIGKEQDTLDVMAGQVQLDTAKSQLVDDSEDTIIEDVMTDIIESSGLTFEHVEDNSVIDFIKDKMGPNSSQFVEAFEVRNISNYQEYSNNFDKSINKNTEMLWHGSRNENWWSIITNCLKIRPSNAVHSGSMFGDGIYFANKFQKSYGYTSGRSSYYARGNSNVAILALYEVHLGNQKHIHKHDSSCYKLCKSVLDKDQFDSVYAHGGIDLRNDEFIIYEGNKCTLKYLVIASS